MNPLIKKFESVAIYTIQKKNANICRSRRKSADFLEMAKCGNAVNKDNKNCWHKWMMTLNGISAVQEHKYKIPLICWLVFKLNNLDLLIFI